VYGGRIYVIGGASMHPGSKETFIHPARPHRAVDTNEVYDPKTNSWEKRSPMPTARNHAAAGMVNNKIYIIAGRIGAAFITRGSSVNIVEEYDPVTDQWGPLKAAIPTARSAVAFGTYRGKIYVAGGEDQDSRQLSAFRAVEAFDPVTNTWTILPSMQFPRHGLAGAFIGNRLHLVSGDAQSASSGAETHVEYHDVLERRVLAAAVSYNWGAAVTAAPVFFPKPSGPQHPLRRFAGDVVLNQRLGHDRQADGGIDHHQYR
jgi:N-acetylneuraminic acid mutarotase